MGFGVHCLCLLFVVSGYFPGATDDCYVLLASDCCMLFIISRLLWFDRCVWSVVWCFVTGVYLVLFVVC